MTSPWDQLADGVFRRRYESLDLNVGLVIGADGVLVVDTRASHRQADQLRQEIGGVTRLPVRWVVNTHWHWDHTFGNARFGEAALWGHTACGTRLRADGEAAKAEAVEMVGEAHRDELEQVTITPPDNLFGETAHIDLGGRAVDLRYLGRGHTDGDIVIAVSDAPVLFAGDLLEEGAPPYFGDGFPLEWPATVERLRTHVRDVVVPGHGDVMSPGDVTAQLEELRAVARLCLDHIDDGVEPGRAEFAEGPYPVRTMRVALERAVAERGHGSR